MVGVVIYRPLASHTFSIRDRSGENADLVKISTSYRQAPEMATKSRQILNVKLASQRVRNEHQMRFNITYNSVTSSSGRVFPQPAVDLDDNRVASTERERWIRCSQPRQKRELSVKIPHPIRALIHPKRQYSNL
ncbi:hypothetical protein TNCV_169961 [Trichonephila clavipes]|nr:hypothetical protein TNCV_169961 [Trichonephila clavipes]